MSNTNDDTPDRQNKGATAIIKGLVKDLEMDITSGPPDEQSRKIASVLKKKIRSK